ncbi:hypothetical protein ANANG_G00198280 [Anguilla anguilla]|uniref:small monomeric GTPase n=1 Tax=Anguilla anguilla TaxID=7936 RepID=A0A9D3RS46_ANGAN|nr:hypothetical protein ANANG_G00198280 [Anguilla anguilla]
MGFILMYDITNEESFNAVQDWSTQIKTYSWDNAQVVLAGNKCDMEEERVVPAASGRMLAEQLGFQFLETSAKENVNVAQTFERLVDIICVQTAENPEADPAVATATPSAKLTDTPAPPSRPAAAVNAPAHTKWPPHRRRPRVCRDADRRRRGDAMRRGSEHERPGRSGATALEIAILSKRERLPYLSITRPLLHAEPTLGEGGAFVLQSRAEQNISLPLPEM